MNRIDRMRTPILVGQHHSLFGDGAHGSSIILFIPFILSKLCLAASINSTNTA
jgi:hypothetical protein